MGSVFPRGQRLWIKYKAIDGSWRNASSGFAVGEESKARQLLREVEARVSAGLDTGEREHGAMTVGRYALRWIERRKQIGLADWRNDQARLRHHVLPRMGELHLDSVRPRHLVDLVHALRTSKKLASKTIYNIYSVLKALFRDAQIADLIVTSPCILTKYQLGEIADKNPEWRPTAIYSRSELEMLISDPHIPSDRQMLYALEGLAALRHGEAAGLRWRHWDNTVKPLGALLIATSYDKGRTKTNRVRRMPVHVVLAATLAEWKLSGWQAMMGRSPTADDLIVPMSKSARVVLGKMRTKNDSHKRCALTSRHSAYAIGAVTISAVQ
ncbi:MAG: integrase family protein [Myxococcales bacterium]|nr:integrase family protein [Myxococcales bacterium]